MLEEIKKLIETKSSLFFRDVEQAHLDSFIQETKEYEFVKEKAGTSRTLFHREAILNITSSLLDNSPLIDSHGWNFESNLPYPEVFFLNAREWDENDQLLFIRWFLSMGNFKFDSNLEMLSNEEEKIYSERLLSIVGQMIRLELKIQEIYILSELKASPLIDWLRLYGLEIPKEKDYKDLIEFMDAQDEVNDFIEKLNDILGTNHLML